MCVLLLFLGPLVLWAQSSSPAVATNTVVTLTPAQQAEQQASQVSNALSSSSNGESAQASNQVSIYEASVDNFVNTQKASAISKYMAQELENEAGKASSSCSATDPATDSDCYLSSTLFGMRDITKASTNSFDLANEGAKNNMCNFISISSIVCSQNTPNVFASALTSPAAFTQEEIQEMNEGLINRGFIVNPRTGVVQVPGSRVIDPSNPESLKKNLGENQTKELLEMIKSIEKAGLKKIAKITRKEIIKKLGLSPAGVQNRKTLASIDSYSDQTFDRRYPSSESQRPAKLSIDEQMVGMSTSYRGEPVGVAKDSLFRMIRFRYQVKANQRSFITVP